MREDYDELVQLNQNGAVSDLQFLLAQEELATAYQAAMAASDRELCDETAREWQLDYENNHLYE